MKKDNSKCKKEAAKYISYQTRVRNRSGYCIATDPSRTKQTRGEVINKNKNLYKKGNKDQLPLCCENVPKPTDCYLCGKKIVNPAVLVNGKPASSPDYYFFLQWRYTGT
eukprot:3570137-Ditylum_brightwellii.AAC.1